MSLPRLAEIDYEGNDRKPEITECSGIRRPQEIGSVYWIVTLSREYSRK